MPTALNQVLVRFGDDETTDAVIAAVQRDRTCWAGGTTWGGMHALRISVCDAATTRGDRATMWHDLAGERQTGRHETGDQTDQESRSAGPRAAPNVSAVDIAIHASFVPHKDPDASQE